MARIAVLRMDVFAVEDGKTLEITTVECPRCGLRMSSPGATLKDARQCAAMLRAACPLAENNTYTLDFFPIPIDVLAEERKQLAKLEDGSKVYDTVLLH
jgi:hypothetical protein